MGASSLASSIGTRSGGIESGMIEPHGSLARGGVPSREEITSPFSVVSTSPWWTRFDNWKRQYFIEGKPNYPQSPQPATYKRGSSGATASPPQRNERKSRDLHLPFA